MLAEGDPAPDFEGTTASGEAIRLSSYRGRPVVLYFYPKASSPGCTLETRAFARLYPELRGHGAEVIGVSVDDVQAQHRFSESCALPFPLVADADQRISREYGVLGAFGKARRVTFIVGADGRVKRTVASLLPGPHVREATRFFGSP